MKKTRSKKSRDTVPLRRFFGGSNSYTTMGSRHCTIDRVADPHRLDADPNADPDSACYFDADPDPDPTSHFYAGMDLDPDPSFQINA
jgi:hypothetical protein